jgi:hypothetical protein
MTLVSLEPSYFGMTGWPQKMIETPALRSRFERRVGCHRANLLTGKPNAFELKAGPGFNSKMG